MTNVASQCIGLLDLTSLQEDDTPARIEELCLKARTPLGSVAAVCVYPQFVASARRALEKSDINIATVVNFPTGKLPAEKCRDLIQQAITDGANEIDFVIDWQMLNETDASADALKALNDYVEEMVRYCGKAKTKAIIESGHLKNGEIIRKASEVCLDAGVNFLKTSTGKMTTGATPEAARVMLEAIKTKKYPGRGLKVAGGIRTPADASMYLEVAKDVMGAAFLCKETFRIGASGLRDALLSHAGIDNYNKSK